jgi:hypothetical protein
MGGHEMISKEKLNAYKTEENWISLTKESSVEEVCRVFNYRECMALAYDLFFKNLHDSGIQDFSVRLFFAIALAYPIEWNTDWKNDAFLGKLCSITWRYDEMYACYKKAYDRLKDPPDSLLILLADCNFAPGLPPISDKESDEYLERAIRKKITYEGAEMMRGRARMKGDKQEEAYWDIQCNELKRKNIHMDTVIPDVLLEQNRG